MKELEALYGGERINHSIEVCWNAKFTGQEFPPQARAVVETIATEGVTDEHLPETVAEMLVLSEAMHIFPVHTVEVPGN